MYKNKEARPRAGIVAIGNELLNGAITDSNTNTIARFFEALGIEVSGARLVPDSETEIIAAIAAAASANELVVTTGGLGPTSDDRTRYAISDFCGKPLREDKSAREKLERLFVERNRRMSETNLRQVLFPEGALVLENREGTADAFVSWAEQGSAADIPIISLPGIPRELRLLLEDQIAPWLSKRFPSMQVTTRRYLRCFGRSESYLGKRIEELAVPAEIEVAYRPMFPEILLSFSDRRPPSPEVDAGLEALIASVRTAVGEEFVFSDQASGSMNKTVFELLLARGLKLSAAESCSGGLFADSLVSLAGSSQVFLASFVTYSNEAKQDCLGVSSQTLLRHGAVSAEAAIEMARGAKRAARADIAVSITGVAGPEGGSAEKPVGTVWIGMATTNDEQAAAQFYAVERNMFRAFCVTSALDLIRRKLLGLPLEWQRL